MKDIDKIKELRALSGSGVMSAKKALTEAKGDLAKARQLLLKEGATTAAKLAGRTTAAGLVDGYLHMGRIGSLVEVNCETDFVARTAEFKKFVHNLAMQVAAADPEPKDVAGLLTLPTLADESKTLADELNELTAKLGEKIVIARFARFELGRRHES